jgi:hypothetical protein
MYCKKMFVHAGQVSMTLPGKKSITACNNILMQDPIIHKLILCVGAGVALSNVNILPELGVYNGAIGIVVEMMYQGKQEGPNDKEHNHLPDYVVVNFPNLKLPTGINPWDKLHKTVSWTY